MSIVESARRELQAAKFGDEDSRVMLEILEKFLDQWDSGGAVSVAQKVLNRCIAGKPLSPLTGADDEFMEVGPGVFQNVRCSTVFKQDGRCYDIDTPGRPTISFPYTPQQDRVRMPIFEIDTGDDNAS